MVLSEDAVTKRANVFFVSSKDSIVHIWDVPGPDKDGVTHAKVPPPLTCAYAAKGSDSDLTSLTWSNDGSLIAVGCYDSVLRICDSNGRAYFTHTQHDVSRFCLVLA